MSNIFKNGYQGVNLLFNVIVVGIFSEDVYMAKDWFKKNGINASWEVLFHIFMWKLYLICNNYVLVKTYLKSTQVHLHIEKKQSVDHTTKWRLSPRQTNEWWNVTIIRCQLEASQTLLILFVNILFFFINFYILFLIHFFCLRFYGSFSSKVGYFSLISCF